MRKLILLAIGLALTAVLIGVLREPSDTKPDSSAVQPGDVQPTDVQPEDAQAAASESLEEVLFEAHFKPYEVPSELLEGPLASTEWGSAARSYQEGDYLQALQGFVSALENEAVPAELVQFYLGQTRLALDDAIAAADAFDKVLKENGTMVVEARWSMALTQLKLGNTQLAKEQLERLVAEKSYKAEQSSLLLDQLSAEM